MLNILGLIVSYLHLSSACKVLSLSGGGPLGSFEMGIASTLMENYDGKYLASLITNGLNLKKDEK